MPHTVALLGFGEAASAFAGGWAARPAMLRAYDIKTDHPATRAAKWADYAAAGITGAATLAEALQDAGAILSLVTADQALRAAAAAAPHLAAGALYADMNSVAPDTKREAARLIEAAGARYLDAAIMSPALPARAAAPLLLSGPNAEAGAATLTAIGFTNIRVLSGDVGRATAVKMIRSVIVKGIEALTAECARAADAAGVLEEVFNSLDASPPPGTWAARADYNLDRMLQHGLRRAAEMEEVARTLANLGTGAVMTEATITLQRRLGALRATSPATLDAKLAVLRGASAAKDAA